MINSNCIDFLRIAACIFRNKYVFFHNKYKANRPPSVMMTCGGRFALYDVFSLRGWAQGRIR